MPNIVKGFFNVKERCYYLFTSVETFDNSLWQAEKMVICWFGLPKTWLILTKKTGVFEVFSKTFFDDPFEKFHDDTK